MKRSRRYEPVNHQKSYQGLSIRAFFHRTRLQEIFRTIRQIPRQSCGRLADFGCSNGYILSRLREETFRHPHWELWGFDHAPPYIALANARNIPGARFEIFDLDLPAYEPPMQFDIVLCLETLEHTGNYRSGLSKLASATRNGGYLLITVPKEVGLPGIVKFFGRSVFRPGSYSEFFRDRSRWSYIRALLTGKDLERFREPPRHGWGEHLGFDVRRFDAYLRSTLVTPGNFDVVYERPVALGFGRIYLLRRVSEKPASHFTDLK